MSHNLDACAIGPFWIFVSLQGALKRPLFYSLIWRAWVTRRFFRASDGRAPRKSERKLPRGLTSAPIELNRRK